MSLDRTSFIPLYHQLIAKLRQKIESGTWLSHSLIPSERQLCKKHQVSRDTLRKALSKLTREGLLYRKQGKGTFVAEPKLTFHKFDTLAKDLQEKGLNPSFRVLQNEKIMPDYHVKTILQLVEGEAVYKVMRLLLANEEPIALATAYFEEKVVPGLDEENLEKVALWNILFQKYKIHITRARETFVPVFADEFETKKLKIPRDSPLFLVRRITYTGHIPFEFSETVVRGDKCCYSVELTYKEMQTCLPEGHFTLDAGFLRDRSGSSYEMCSRKDG